MQIKLKNCQGTLPSFYHQIDLLQIVGNNLHSEEDTGQIQ